MKTSIHGINMIKDFEKCVLTAYLDAVNVWTIGYGVTHYKNGVAVKRGDVITQAKADELLHWQVRLKESAVDRAIYPVCVNQNQFDALVSFTYNVGVGAFQSSTLLRKLRTDPANETIRDEFMKWVKGRVRGELVTLKGLVKRRKAEADLYFEPIEVNT